MENVVDLFLAQAKVRPDSIALIDRHAGRDRTTTFAALEDQSARIAALLARRGIGAGSPVLLFHPPTAELYAVIIAIFRLGAIAMVVDVSAGKGTLAAACRELPPAAMFASGRALLLALASAPLRAVRVKLTSAPITLGATRLAGARRLPRHEGTALPGGDAPALVTFTSGSTGAAKGAVRTHAILAAQHEALGSVAAATGERDLVSLPIVVLTNLGNGATSVIPDGDLRRPGAIDAGAVLDQVTRHAVQRITASPALVERLVEGTGGARSEALHGVRIVTGGGPVFPDLVRRATARAGVPLTAVYGSTEAEPIAHVTSADLGDAEIRAMRDGAGLLAGTPVRETRVCIVPAALGDEQMRALLRGATAIGAGTQGEILVSGRHVVPGYLHGRGDAETKVWLDGSVWHRTGDAGYLDVQGRLWLLGRMGAAVRDARGELHPFAVECAARLVIPGRRSVLAGHRGARILLVERPLDAGERASLGEALGWARLDRIIDNARIPLDRRHNSKVDYAALPALLDRLAGTPAA